MLIKDDLIELLYKKGMNLKQIAHYLDISYFVVRNCSYSFKNSNKRDVIISSKSKLSDVEVFMIEKLYSKFPFHYLAFTNLNVSLGEIYNLLNKPKLKDYQTYSIHNIDDYIKYFYERGLKPKYIEEILNVSNSIVYKKIKKLNLTKKKEKKQKLSTNTKIKLFYLVKSKNISFYTYSVMFSHYDLNEVYRIIKEFKNNEYKLKKCLFCGKTLIVKKYASFSCECIRNIKAS